MKTDKLSHKPACKLWVIVHARDPQSVADPTDAPYEGATREEALEGTFLSLEGLARLGFDLVELTDDLAAQIVQAE